MIKWYITLRGAEDDNDIIQGFIECTHKSV